MFRKRKAKKKVLNINSIKENNEQNEENDSKLGKRSLREIKKGTEVLNVSSKQILAGYEAAPKDSKVEFQSGANSKDAYRRLKDENELAERDAKKNENRKVLVGPMPPKPNSARSFLASQHSNGIDYNPSLCKDYHETGYCVWGNTCIYAHDRTDYKRGWQQDKDWEEKQRRKAERRKRRQIAKENGLEDEVSDSTDSEELEDYEDDTKYGEIDEECLICGHEYKDPVVTECGHVFCEKCALSNFSSSKVCFKCDKPISGIFNDGTNVLKNAIEEKSRINSLRKERKKKKKFGEVAVYLREVDKDYNGFDPRKERNGNDEYSAVVVKEDEIRRARERLNLQPI